MEHQHRVVLTAQRDITALSRPQSQLLAPQVPTTTLVEQTQPTRALDPTHAKPVPQVTSAPTEECQLPTSAARASIPKKVLNLAHYATLDLSALELLRRPPIMSQHLAMAITVSSGTIQYMKRASARLVIIVQRILKYRFLAQEELTETMMNQRHQSMFHSVETLILVLSLTERV